ncbi:hypothetical protein CCR95_07340 [Thiocystis minor]|nr:hypothetical protein [Thiocystis minor]
MPFKDGTGPSQPGQGQGRGQGQGQGRGQGQGQGRGQGRGQGGCRGRQAANRAGLSHAGGQGGRGQGAGTKGSVNPVMSWMQQQLTELRSMVQQLTERLDTTRPDSHS